MRRNQKEQESEFMDSIEAFLEYNGKTFNSPEELHEFTKFVEIIKQYTGKIYNSPEELEKAEQELREKLKPFTINE